MKNIKIKNNIDINKVNQICYECALKLKLKLNSKLYICWYDYCDICNKFTKLTKLSNYKINKK